MLCGYGCESIPCCVFVSGEDIGGYVFAIACAYACA